MIFFTAGKRSIAVSQDNQNFEASLPLFFYQWMYRKIESG
jgi:hypothetical protein